jgi:hypothetical protein
VTTAVDAARAGMRSSRLAQTDRRRLLIPAGYGVRECARGISGPRAGCVGLCTTRVATVVVRVHHAGFGGNGLGYLVGGAGRRQARADIQELADPPLPGQVADHAGEERAIGPGPGHYLRSAGSDFLSGLTIGRVMSFTAEPYIVDASWMRYIWVKPGRGGQVCHTATLRMLRRWRQGC